MRDISYFRARLMGTTVGKDDKNYGVRYGIDLSVVVGHSKNYKIEDIDAYSKVVEDFMSLFSYRYYYVYDISNDMVLKYFLTEEEAVAYINEQWCLDSKKNLIEEVTVQNAPAKKRKM